VYLALCTPDGARARQLSLRGRPHEIAREAVAVALAELNRELRRAVGDLILRQTSSRCTSVLGATRR
jgi:hypothetical protein